MSYPRLDTLSYRVVPVDEDRDDLSDAAPATFELGEFDCWLDDGWLDARPRGHFDDQETGRAVFEPLLREWEAIAELECGVRLKCLYQGSRVEDPRPEDGIWGRVETDLTLDWTRVEVRPAVSHSTYPLPAATRFRESPPLASLRERIRDYREGRDRLLAVGYYALTLLTREYGGRQGVADFLEDEAEILDKLNELTSKRSDARHERKAIRAQPLTREEHDWVEAAIRRLAVRAGQREAGASGLPSLGMSDL